MVFNFSCETLPLSPIKQSSPTPPKIRLNDVTLLNHHNNAPQRIINICPQTVVLSRNLPPIPGSPASVVLLTPTVNSDTFVKQGLPNLAASSSSRPNTRAASRFFPSLTSSSSTKSASRTDDKKPNVATDDVIASGKKRRQKSPAPNCVRVHGNRAFELRVNASPSTTSSHRHKCNQNQQQHGVDQPAAAVVQPEPRRPVTRYFKMLHSGGGTAANVVRRKSIALKRLSNAKRLSVMGNKKRKWNTGFERRTGLMHFLNEKIPV